jgi:ribosomal protein S27AE
LEDVPDLQGQGDTQYTISPVGVWIACLGGALLALSTFLPLDEPSGRFARVQSNTLIQHEGWLLGWSLILAGALIALSAVAGKRRPISGRISVVLLSFLAIALVVDSVSDKSLRTLYPIGGNGQPEASAVGTVVPLGVAVYIAGAGAAMSLIGGCVMLRTRQVIAPTVAQLTRQCPDCAETILADAHVCGYCGYRFDEPPSGIRAPG